MKLQFGPLQRAIVDLIAIAIVLCVVFYLISGLDLFERLNDFSRSHEDWELDELILAVLLSVVGVYVFSIRRLFDQRREIKIRQKAEYEANRLAQVDPLTGLANRRRFEERLTEGLAEISERGGRLALLMIDLDHFKPVNDNFGHAIGDQFLIAFAQQANRLLGSNGLLARVGGDEFAIILQPLSNDEEPSRLAQQILALFDYPFETSSGARVAASSSVGVAVAPQDATTAADLIERADIALYRAKDGGRRNYCFFQPSMYDEERRRAEIKRDLRKAITDGSIHPFYQPIVDLRTRVVTGFEALARWHHPVLGDVPPREFMEIAENSGLVGLLSTHLLRRACRDAAAWPKTVRLAFNLSRAQLADPTLVLRTVRILGETGFSPQRLEIEISEAVLTSDVRAAKDALKTFHETGIRVSLDDFGEGSSSINHLRQFRFDRLKIDRSFIAGVTDTDEDLAFVRAILNLSQALKVPVTAEGIERDDTVALLIAEGCEEGQGFIFGKAMPADEASAYLDILQTRDEAV